MLLLSGLISIYKKIFGYSACQQSLIKMGVSTSFFMHKWMYDAFGVHFAFRGRWLSLRYQLFEIPLLYKRLVFA